MDEVSNRVLKFYAEAVESAGIEPQRLVDGQPQLGAALRGERHWYDWTQHILVLDRFQHLVGGEEAALRLAALASEAQVSAPLRAVATFIGQPKYIYRAGFSWFARSMYRNVGFSYSEHPDGSSRARVEVNEPYAPHRLFFRMWESTLRSSPRMLELPDARISVEYSGRAATYRIEPPRRRSVLSRSASAARLLLGAKQMLVELRRHEDELERAFESLAGARHDLAEAERLATLGRLAASVSHELGTPLGVVAANVELLRKGVNGSEAHAHLALVQGAVDRMAATLQQLKSFYAPKGSSESPCELAGVLDASLRLSARALGGARVERDFEPVPLVRADRHRLEQLFVNLLVNAGQAVESRGEPCVRIRLRRDGGEVHVQVSDNGPGVEAAALPRVFEPFFTTRAEGTGLGLAICRRIATECGGRILLASTRGKGATVDVFLPVSGAHASTEPLPFPSAGLEVLVVDDQPNFVLSLKHLLSAHRVDGATSAAQALELVAQRRYDAILCDVCMRPIDGAQLYGSIVATAPELAPRVIFMTGAMVDDGVRAFIEGLPNACLEKPFSSRAVEEAIAKAAGAQPTAGCGEAEAGVG